MDAALREMILTAYDETFQDALGQGHDSTTAHAEGITAAAMCLAAMTGLEDQAARTQVEAMALAQQLAA